MVCERWCVCVTKLCERWCDKAVCEIRRVTELSVKDGV